MGGRDDVSTECISQLRSVWLEVVGEENPQGVTGFAHARRRHNI